MKLVLAATKKRVCLEDWQAEADGSDAFLVSTGAGKSSSLFWTPHGSLAASDGSKVPAAETLRAWLDAERGLPDASRPRVRVSWTSQRFGGYAYRVRGGAIGAWRCCVAYDDGTIERGIRWARIAWDDEAAASRHAPRPDAPRPGKRKAGGGAAPAPKKLTVEGGGAKIAALLPASQRPHAAAVADFFAFVHERQEVWRRRASGEDEPWTRDALLRHYVFCNNYRELDRGTQYLRRCLAKLEAPATAAARFKRMLWPCLAYRLCNKLETFARDWDGKGGGIPAPGAWPAFEAYLREQHALGPVFTNAHQSMGLDRYVATMRAARTGLAALSARLFAVSGDAEAVFGALQASCDNVGPFLAWQVVCDLMESGCVDASEDAWAQLGPGAKRGLARCFGAVAPCDELDLAKLLARIHGRAFKNLGLDFCYVAGRRLTLKNVEHCLCEYEKYRNNGAGMRHYRSRAHLDGAVTCATCRDPSDARDAELLLCDLCAGAYHATCLDPPLADLPTTPWWMCPPCAARWAAAD